MSAERREQVGREGGPPWCPAAFAAAKTARPRRPLAPVTRILTIESCSQRSSLGEVEQTKAAERCFPFFFFQLGYSRTRLSPFTPEYSARPLTRQAQSYSLSSTTSKTRLERINRRRRRRRRTMSNSNAHGVNQSPPQSQRPGHSHSHSHSHAGLSSSTSHTNPSANSSYNLNGPRTGGDQRYRASVDTGGAGGAGRGWGRDAAASPNPRAGGGRPASELLSVGNPGGAQTSFASPESEFRFPWWLLSVLWWTRRIRPRSWRVDAGRGGTASWKRGQSGGDDDEQERRGRVDGGGRTQGYWVHVERTLTRSSPCS